MLEQQPTKPKGPAARHISIIYDTVWDAWRRMDGLKSLGPPDRIASIL